MNLTQSAPGLKARKNLFTVSFALIVVLVSQVAHSITPTEVAELIASENSNNQAFGYAVALDGNIALIGAALESGAFDNTGAAYVFTFDGTTWSEQQKLTASDGNMGALFGSSVALAGNTALIGAPRQQVPTNLFGSVYVFTFDGATWSEQQIIKPNMVSNTPTRFGQSLAVDGDTALIGATFSSALGWPAYIFTYDGSDWSETQRLNASDQPPFVSPFPSFDFGWSVDLDGDTALVGAYMDTGNGPLQHGSAYVFTYDGTTWSEQQKLTASDAAHLDRFGFSVSVDGDTAVIGAVGDSPPGGFQTFNGSAYVFARNGTSWSEQQKLTANDSAFGDRFGASVAVEGTTALIGAYHNDHSGLGDNGAVYAYSFDGSQWQQAVKFGASEIAPGIYHEIVPGGSSEFSSQVQGIAFSGDTALIGAPSHTHSIPNPGNIFVPILSSGAAYVFSLGLISDSDGDGVPDDLDICPGGDDTVDFDGDSVPDFCDPCPIDPDNDADGDGVCGDLDVCPLGDDNLDADGDGTPDFCDVCLLDFFNDADGDGVCGDVDNCPLTANSDQTDSDEDGAGNVCDLDDDNDGSLDENDNCPLDANPLQLDFDGDGVGDFCDSDDDNDSVADNLDACPMTVTGEVVETDGCSVNDLCPCDNHWKNHGAYVRCVAHTSEDFVAAGLITEVEKDTIVSMAGMSSCGKKK